ncbi:MAG: ABC transporter permease [Desulforhopalus sp.]|nr:ABC transporter permease [Desulforhopalus sp.]
MNLRFLFREIVHSRGQAAIFVLCVALSLVSIVAINSFRRDVQGVIAGDARSLHGGDVIVRSNAELSPPLSTELAELRREEGIAAVSTWEFYSVARRQDGKATLFSNITAVENGYPLYGRVELRSGRELAAVLGPGKAIVAETLLQRLGLAVGDPLLLGGASLEIVDVVGRESLRPVDFFNFGPRIIVSTADLQAMDLVGKGSRVSYKTLVKLADQSRQEAIVARLQAKAAPGQERVSTAADAGSRVKRFFDNLLFFLSLISVFTLLLAGIGMQSSLAALLRRKVKSFAIIRALGATSGFLLGHYLLLVLFLSVIGSSLGIVAGLLVKQSFTGLLAGLLPENIALGVSFRDLLEGLGLGLVVVAFFTFLPLSGIEGVKPSAIFRKEAGAGLHRKTTRILLGCGLLLLLALVARQLDDVRSGLYFVGGVAILVVCIAASIDLLLRLLARCTFRTLALRQAVRSLLRPGNASRAVIVTLASALAVLFAIYLVEENLRATYINSYPADAPNFFCLDIQKEQQQGFVQLVGREVELFPVVRGRLQAINGSKINREAELQKRGDSLAREFSLTYRETLLADEVLVAGEGLFGGRDRPGDDLPPVSLLDTVVEMGDFKIGDILDFNIQGVPLRAEVTSIRSRTKSMLYPFFYFVFPEKYLRAAPQTSFAALKVTQDEVAQLENTIVNTYPNISPINVGESAAELGRLMEKLSVMVTFFASFSILAGGLILVSSILATRMARMEEAVHYKILGANTFFVLRVFLLENLLLALFSGIAAVFVAEFGSWALCHYYLGFQAESYWQAGFILVAGTALLVVLLGLLSSVTIIRQKPGRYLREQA